MASFRLSPLMKRITLFQTDPWSDPSDFFSPHTGVGYFAFADGSVHGMKTSTYVAVLQALATRAGNDIPPGDW